MCGVESKGVPGIVISTLSAAATECLNLSFNNQMISEDYLIRTMSEARRPPHRRNRHQRSGQECDQQCLHRFPRLKFVYKAERLKITHRTVQEPARRERVECLGKVICELYKFTRGIILPSGRPGTVKVRFLQFIIEELFRMLTKEEIKLRCTRAVADCDSTRKLDAVDVLALLEVRYIRGHTNQRY